jgi:hypothetical protein
MMNQQDRILIERYLDNRLSGYELQQFMLRLENEPAFREKVSFQNLMMESIREADQHNLAEQVKANIRYKKSLVPFGLKLIMTFLLITAGGIVLWNYVGPEHQHSRVLSFDFLKPDKDKPEEQPQPKTFAVKKDSIVKDTSTVAADVNTVPETTAVTDSLSGDEYSPDDIVIKKDQLLVSYTLKVIPIDPPDKKDTLKDLSQTTASKLNPPAGLPEDTERELYDVEFWVSPINYKGYRLSHDRLVLFGIEEPDAVRLFYFDGKLVMNYGHNYFSLHPSNEFVSFSSIKEIDLPSALK